MTRDSDNLRAVRKLLNEPESWTKTSLARDAQGRGTYTRDDNAVAWCLEGAIYRTCLASEWNYAEQFLRKAIERTTCASTRCCRMVIEDFNDDPSTTHALLLAVIDTAIGLAEPAAQSEP